MKEKIKQSIAYYREEKALFIQNKAAIQRLNNQCLNGLLFGSSVMCATISIIIAFIGGYADIVVIYAVTALVFIMFYILHGVVSGKCALPSFYLFFAALLGYSAYSAAIVYPDFAGVISLGVFLLMPILILDKIIRGTLIETILLIVYLIFVIPRKEGGIHQDEMIYNISFSLLGQILGLYLRKVRLENLELLRQGKIRETTDVLTGLYNRRKLFDYFAECEAGKTEETVSGISILDIDFFKNYNDTYGHLAGDKCLKAVGNCMRTYGEQHDMEFYRYGGEEFVAVAHETNRKRIEENFENIVKAVEDLQIPIKSGVVTISQGVCLLTDKAPENLPIEMISGDENRKDAHLHGMRFQQYLSKADAALYRAKEQGRNRSVFEC